MYGGLNNAGTGALTITNGNLIVDCQRSISGGNNYTTINNHIVDLRGLITFTGGTVTIVNPSASASVGGYASFALTTINAASNLVGGTIQFGDGTSTYAGGSTNGYGIYTTGITKEYTLGNIIINGNALPTLNRFVKIVSTGNIYVAGTITINSNSEIQLGGKTLFLQGNLINNGSLNSTTVASTLSLNGSTQQIISGTGTFSNGTTTGVNNLIINNTSGSSPAVDLQCPLSVQTALTLTTGILGSSTNVANLSLGNSTASTTLTITRTNGSLDAAFSPTWNVTGVTTIAINYNTASGAISTGNELPIATNATVTSLTINNSGGVILNNTSIAIKTLTLTSGIFNFQNGTVNLTGTIVRNGTTQTGTISSGTGASVTLSNPVAWTVPTSTFTSNTIELSNITISEGAGITVTLPTLTTITINGTLTLNTGRLALGGTNSLIFQSGNTPISVVSGSLTTNATTSLAFIDGSTSGAAFTLPSGMFTTPSFQNLTINRTNKIALSTQPLSLSGTLTLTKGEFDNNSLVFTTTGTIPFATYGGTFTVGATGSITFGANATQATIPNGFFTSAPVSMSRITMNRVGGGITLGNQEIDLTSGLTLTSGILGVNNANVVIQSSLTTAVTGGSTSTYVALNGSGILTRAVPTIAASATFSFPIGDNVGHYSPASITFTANASSGTLGVSLTNTSHPSKTDNTDYLNKYWVFTSTGLTTYSYSNATFGYQITGTSDVSGTETNLIGQVWTGSAWTSLETTSSVNPTTHILSTGAFTNVTAPLLTNSYTAFGTTKYYWSKVTGNWNAPATWVYTTSPTDPGAGGTVATTYPTASNSKSVTIRTGNTVTVNAAGLSTDQLSVAGTLALGANTLTVYDGTGIDILVPSGGTISSTTGLISAFSSTVSIDIFGSITTGNLTGLYGSATTAIKGTNNVFIELGSTVTYTGLNPIISSTPTYSNVVISNGGTLNGDVNVGGNVTISAGTLTMGPGPVARTLTVAGNLNATATLNMANAAHTLLLGGISSLTTLTTDANPSTISYNGSNQNIMTNAGVATNYRNLVLAGTGTKSLSGGITVNNNLTINSGITFADGGNTCTVKGNVLNNGLYSGNGKISLAGSSSQTITAGPLGTFSNIEIMNNTTLASDLTVNGALTIGAGTLAFGNTARNVTVTGNLVGTGGTIDMSGAVHSMTLKGSSNILSTLTTDANQSTITYNGATQSVFGSLNYKNLVITETGTKTLLGAVTANNLTIDNGAIFADGGFVCTVNGVLTNNSIHSSTTSGKIIYNGSSISCGSSASFGNLEINNNTGISGDIIIINGTFSILGGNTITFNTISTSFEVKGSTTVAGTISFMNTTGTKSFSDVSITSFGRWVSGVSENYDLKGNFLIDPAGSFVPGSGKYTFGGALNQTISSPTSFNLSLLKTAGSVSYTSPTLSDITFETGNAGSFSAPANLTITGDIIMNNGSASWGTNVTLTGSVDQIISGNVPAFTNLTINNSYTSGNAIVLQCPITINGILNLTKGVISSDATSSLTLGTSASLSGTQSDASFVDGPMTYTISSTTPTTVIFPIGKNGKLRQAEITVDQAATSPTSTYTCEYIRSNAKVLAHALPTTLINVSGLGFWTVHKSPESLDASGNDAYLDNASILLHYLNDDGVKDVSHLYVAKSNTVTGEWLNVGRASVDGSTISSGTFKAFCDISLGTDCSCNPLPISLEDFSVHKKDENILIKWTTASETNNDYFTLERSHEGETWSAIYTGKGAGNSSQTNVYSYVDNENQTGTIYYRLKQTDFDGESMYSPIRSITLHKADCEFTIYPNPSTADNINVFIEKSASKVVFLEVTDNVGRVIYSSQITTNGNSKMIDLSRVCQLHSGIFYNITVISDGVTMSKKIAIQ